MKTNTHFQHLFELQFAMLCISTSGALGRYIELPPPLTIWCRAFFALIFLGVYCLYKGFKFQLDLRKNGWVVLSAGFLMMLHWVLYFYALQWSNVAIGMLSLMTYPVMTALLEPLILKTPFEKSQLLLGGLVLLGIYFLVPDFNLENSTTMGLLIGLLSALAYALRNIFLKTKINTINGSMLMFYQIAVTLVVLLPVLMIYDLDAVAIHVPYLVILGLVTTAIGHTLFLNSFKYFSVSTASIMSSVQPIYGILIAMFFLHEYPSWSSIIGGVLILSTVGIESFRSYKS